MLCQFKAEGEKPVLKDIYNFESDVYPVGRLDSDSEGLLLLTNDKSVNNKLLNPENKHKRTYLVQVEGDFSEAARQQLEKGVTISIEGKSYNTKHAICEILDTEPMLPERFPPIRYRKLIPVTWIKLTLTEGKNRQVRRMTAAVGFPTLRLVRESIEGINIKGMKSGQVFEIHQKEFYSLLKL
jgi:23S rRNA pseudouridine2457 synthase